MCVCCDGAWMCRWLFRKVMPYQRFDAWLSEVYGFHAGYCDLPFEKLRVVYEVKSVLVLCEIVDAHRLKLVHVKSFAFC